MRKQGLWKKDGATAVDQFPECDLRSDLLWIGRSFFDLSNKRGWIGGGFGAVPQPIETSRIREHFYDELHLKGAGLYNTFRMLIDKMDGDWTEDWRSREDARRRADEEDRKHQQRGR